MAEVDVQIRGDNLVLTGLQNLQKIVPDAMRRAILKEANYLVGQIKLGIRNQAPGGVMFKPLAASTLRRKKNKSKALIQWGDLMDSINVKEIGNLRTNGAAFVGVHRTAARKRGRKGPPLVNIAAIHENGTRPYTIPVTPRLRRWWFAMFMQGVFSTPLSRRRTVINHPGVPKRAFIRPAFDRWNKNAPERIAEAVAADVAKALEKR